jgi:hypothetical protein
VSPPWSRCPANVAHVRQSRPNYGLGVHVKFLKPSSSVPTSLGSGRSTSFASIYSGSTLNTFSQIPHYKKCQSLARHHITPSRRQDPSSLRMQPLVKSLRSSYTGLYPQILVTARNRGRLLAQFQSSWDENLENPGSFPVSRGAVSTSLGHAKKRTNKTVKARIWPWLSGTSPSNISSCSLFTCEQSRPREKRKNQTVRPDSGLGFQVKVLQMFRVVPSSLGSDLGSATREQLRTF